MQYYPRVIGSYVPQLLVRKLSSGMVGRAHNISFPPRMHGGNSSIVPSAFRPIASLLEKYPTSSTNYYFGHPRYPPDARGGGGHLVEFIGSVRETPCVVFVAHRRKLGSYVPYWYSPVRGRAYTPHFLAILFDRRQSGTRGASS
jgi:hypothetical protein